MMAGGHDQVKSTPGDIRESTSNPTKDKDVSTSTTEHEVNSLVASIGSDGAAPRPHRILPPFIASHDLPRGAIFAFQSLLAYALMLAVMWVLACFSRWTIVSNQLTTSQDFPSCLLHLGCGWTGCWGDDFRKVRAC